MLVGRERDQRRRRRRRFLLEQQLRTGEVDLVGRLQDAGLALWLVPAVERLLTQRHQVAHPLGQAVLAVARGVQTDLDLASH